MRRLGMARSRRSVAVPFEEAGQQVAVKVDESEGGGVALADVVDNIEVEVTVRARFINSAGL
jgi:hypothetical protein